MTIALRDRPDGQVEIVLSRPEVIGVMAGRDMAERFVAFLQEEEPELKLAADYVPDADDADLVSEAQGPVVGDITTVAPARANPMRPQPSSSEERALRRKESAPGQLPAVIETPKPPAVIRPVVPAHLTEAQLDQAFGRIAAGEKIAVVAADIGTTFGSLRGLWANHCRKMQRHIAEGRQIECRLCQKPFTPSISNPETCARCSHD